MGRLVVTEFVTLDGVTEAPGGEPSHPHSGWVFDYQSPQQGDFKMKETFAAEALVLGRVTYEGFAAAWPQREGEFADKFNAMPKHVVTSTLTDADLEWNNSRVLSGPVEESVAHLKAEAAGELQVHGSQTLVKALLLAGLVDELRAMVFPVLLGSGKRMWPEGQEKIPLALRDVERFDSGVVVLTYGPA
jgi:dihydrofolate reductase